MLYLIPNVSRRHVIMLQQMKIIILMVNVQHICNNVLLSGQEDVNPGLSVQTTFLNYNVHPIEVVENASGIQPLRIVLI